MADPDSISSENLQELRQSLSTPTLAPVLDQAGRAGKLGDALDLVEAGIRDIGACDENVAAAVQEFLNRGGGRADYERAKRHMFQLEKDLPKEFVDLPSPLDDLLRLDSEMQADGSDNHDVFRDKENLVALKKGGLAGMHIRKIRAGAVSQMTGVPREIVEKQPLKDSVQGAAFSQHIGHPQVVKDPAFWEDFRKAKSGSGGFSKGDFATKWMKRAEEWNAAEAEKMKRKLDKAFQDYQSALIDQELKRRRREREERARARARRRRRARLITPKPEDIQIATYKDWPVLTPSGANYFVRIWDDGTTELYRFHEGMLYIVAANFAYYELRDPRTGQLGVVPVLGFRPRTPRPISPQQVPGGPRGALGRGP